MVYQDAFMKNANWRPSSDGARDAQAYRDQRLVERERRFKLGQLAQEQAREQALREAYNASTDAGGKLNEQALYRQLKQMGLSEAIIPVREKYESAYAAAQDKKYKRAQDKAEAQRKQRETQVKVDKETREGKKFARDDARAQEQSKYAQVAARVGSLAQVPGVDRDTAVVAIKQMLDEGTLDERTGQRLIQGIPRDPRALAPYLRSLSLQAMDADKRFKAQAPDEPTAWQKMQDATERYKVDKRTGADLDKARLKAEADAKKASAPKEMKLSSNAEKAIEKADETIQRGASISGMLGRALELNKKAYAGWGANARAKVVGSLSDDSENANATLELENILNQKALMELKDLFVGATTNVELEVNQHLQGLRSPNPQVREKILARLKELVDERVEFNRSKRARISQGTYYTEVPEGPPGDQPPGQGGRPNIDPSQLPPGARQAKDGNYYVADPNTGRWNRIDP